MPAQESAQDRPPSTETPTPTVDDSLTMKLLPFLLSIIAGSVDIIGFLGLGGLFTAHITGNLVILAARLVAHDPAPVSFLIAVPVFVIGLGISRLLVAGLERVKIRSLLPLLFLQAILLFGFLSICVANGPQTSSDCPSMVVAGMLAVSAMAVQNVLARVSIVGAPSTAVMTTNITVFIIDAGEILFGTDSRRAFTALERARRTWPAIVGFGIGCAMGALFELALGLHSAALPAGFALLALALGVGAHHGRKHC